MSTQRDESIKIEITTDTSQQALLSGLDVWLRLGLLNASQIKVELTTSSSHPELLTGLDGLLELGVLNDTLVKKLCRKNLTCLLPDVVARGTVLASPQMLSNLDTDFAPASPTAAREPSRIRQMLQSLQAEFSVRWLLFLGVFMVVVSSGVLAASQWQKFPASGQYGVLLAYTLIFWGVSFWASGQSNLRLTAQTLQAVSLLLVPVNFWAMDGFGLWRHPLDWITVAIATATLSAITVFIYKIQNHRQSQGLLLPNYLLLCYLHWGWGWSGFPLIAVYLGTLGTIATFYLQDRRRRAEGGIISLFIIHPSTFLQVVYAIGVLLFRAIFVVGVDIHDLGLAIGACGWLLSWVYKPSINHDVSEPINSSLVTTAQSRPFSQVNGERLGGGLLFFGWVVSVGEQFPWQAIALSGLILWLISSRLQRFWQRWDLAALLAIGLQTIWLFWCLVPPHMQLQLVAIATQLTNSQDTPYALLSLVLFPYVIFIVWLTDWLKRLQQPDLAKFGEAIALSMGAVLTSLSLVNPLLRTLNLLASTITLGIVTQRRSRAGLVYLTHITGLTTIVAAIDYLLPNLNLSVWAGILLTLMVAEWEFSLGEERTVWRRSAWHLGLGLAGLSYVLMSVNYSKWGLLWLIVPLSLTGVSTRSVHQRQLAGWLSVTALGMAQILTLGLSSGRLISLGIATGLMFVNTRYLRHLNAAIITVGFGLGFVGMLLWEGVPGFPRLSTSGWLVAGAIALPSLWLLRSWLIRRSTELAQFYAQAIDGWAIALCSLELFLLTVHSLPLYWGMFPGEVTVLVADAVTMGAIAYRSWHQPSNWAFYGLGWSLELLTAEILGFTGYSAIKLAIANFALGLIAQLVGDLWRRRGGISQLPSSWHVIPLLYGILGTVLRWDTFTSWTGLYTLALALIAIGVGRRREELKPLVYIGVVGVSVSSYELLFYQISHLPPGDLLVAMAALGTSIMYAYRVLSPWLTEYLHLTSEELKLISHLHWALSSCLLISATTNPIQSLMLGLGTGGFLVQYAIFQGRNNPAPSVGEIWVYVGFLEALGIRFYWLSTPVARLLSGPLTSWKGAIASVFAYLLYVLPWESWGWQKKPWQRIAFIVPLIAIGENPVGSQPVSLLIVAAFYVGLAIIERQIRFTYISAVLIDWVLFRWFWYLQLSDSLWYVIPVGLTLLYIAQVDPDLRLPEQKQGRHNLRLLGSGAICIVALWSNQWSGIVPGVISLLVIFAGLALRVRAFLYIGTATFLVNAFYQLVVLIFDYPFLKWVIGLIVGISILGIAGTFETRREQITSLVRNWVSELRSWE
jgi:hypothetical protein